MGNSAQSHTGDGEFAHDEEDNGGRSQGSGLVQLAATKILALAGTPAYHTSIILDGREYFFDSLGVVTAAPMWSHMAGGTRPLDEERTEVIPMGDAQCSGQEMAEALSPFFQKGSYDILYKNCNHFTDCALYMLCRKRLGSQYNRLERMLANPMSTALINRLFDALTAGDKGKDSEAAFYSRNPNSEDYSTSGVIAAIEAMSDSEDSDYTPTCGIFNEPRQRAPRRSLSRDAPRPARAQAAWQRQREVASASWASLPPLPPGGAPMPTPSRRPGLATDRSIGELSARTGRPLAPAALSQPLSRASSTSSLPQRRMVLVMKR